MMSVLRKASYVPSPFPLEEREKFLRKKLEAMITNFAVNNDTFMELDLKAGVRAAMIPAIK